MYFSFTPEQEDLRREARAFLEADPVAFDGAARELEWVGCCAPASTRSSTPPCLFEELGRVLYEGPFVLNEVAAQPGGRDLVDRDRRASSAPRRGDPRA
jgi:hypothetical protein